MRAITTTVLVLAIWSGAASAQNSRSAPLCKADQAGKILLTSIEYNDGYKVEAPWRVITTQKSKDGNQQMRAILDHIIETKPLSKKRQLTPLPGAIEMTFRGTNNNVMLREAADIWCSTVAKAIALRPAESSGRVTESRLVM
jgi:hypothetical protein